MPGKSESKLRSFMVELVDADGFLRRMRIEVSVRSKGSQRTMV